MKWNRRLSAVIGIAIVVLVAGAIAYVLVLFTSPASTEEVDTAKRWFDEAPARFAAAPCERPVLRGAATSGSATELLSDLLSADGAHAECIEAVDLEAVPMAFDGHYEDGREWRWNLPDERELDHELPTPDGWRAPSVGAPPFPRDDLPNALERVLATCGALPSAVSEAVGHEASCSPWVLGRAFASIDELLNALRLGWALSILAVREAMEGDTDGAFDLIFDGVRLAHDLERHHVRLAEAIFAKRMQETLWAAAQTILPAIEVDDALVRRLDTEIAVLVDSAPALSPIVQAEIVDRANVAYRPYVEAPGWSPPHGRSPLDEPPRTPDGVAPQAVSRQVGEIGLVAFMTLGKQHDELGSMDILRSFTRMAASPPNRQAGSLGTLVLGPRGLSEQTVQELRFTFVSSVAMRLRTLLATSALPRGILALAHFYRLRAGDRCPAPNELGRGLLEIPDLEGSLEVRSLSAFERELLAPATLAPPGGPYRLPIVLAICPRSPIGVWRASREPSTP
jgi:hypothetical protein